MSSDPFRESVEGFDGTYPPFWDPNPGDKLVGQIIRYERGTTQYGPCWIAVTLDEDTGDTVSVWLTGYVLQNEFEKLKPRVGERIGIKFMGKAEKKQGGGEYNSYFVGVDRRGEASPFDVQPADPTPVAAVRALVDAPVIAAPRDWQGDQRDDLQNLKDEWKNWLNNQRIESWQVDALSEAHPDLPESVDEWRVDDYRLALALCRSKGVPVFAHAVKKRAEEHPPMEADVELFSNMLEEFTDALSQRDRFRLIEARDSGWNDALLWASEELKAILIADGAIKEPTPAPDPREPDDDLPF